MQIDFPSWRDIWASSRQGSPDFSAPISSSSQHCSSCSSNSSSSNSSRRDCLLHIRLSIYLSLKADGMRPSGGPQRSQRSHLEVSSVRESPSIPHIISRGLLLLLLLLLLVVFVCLWHCIAH